MKKIIRLTESDLSRIVKRIIMEQPTKTKMGTLDDSKLHMTACRSWSRMDNDTKTQYKNWSKKQIGRYPYDLDVACESDVADSIGGDKDRRMLKAVIDLDFI